MDLDALVVLERLDNVLWDHGVEERVVPLLVLAQQPAPSVCACVCVCVRVCACV